ncbi:hypothetical protein [Mesorhizobium sp. M0814]|uniref:hypothetical protein n=1 Tax=unclassified Mesorhizobium TaxID=325217 RepID=UPI003337992A
MAVPLFGKRHDRKPQEDLPPDAASLQPKMRGRFTVTTDTDHNQPIFPNLARDFISGGPDQLWVADLTYVTVVAGLPMLPLSLHACRGGYRIRHHPLDRRSADADGFGRRCRRTQTATPLRIILISVTI